MEKIFDGNDRAQAQGYADYQTYLRKLPLERPQTKYIPWNGEINAAETPLQAYIDGGRWLVRCFCGCYCYVTPGWPYHWCMVCGNSETGRAAIPVHFPPAEKRQAIEQALLARPIQASKNIDPLVAAADAYPLIPGLRRDWFPGQSIEFLYKTNEANGL